MYPATRQVYVATIPALAVILFAFLSLFTEVSLAQNAGGLLEGGQSGAIVDFQKYREDMRDARYVARLIGRERGRACSRACCP
jgi:hypothetical protein